MVDNLADMLDKIVDRDVNFVEPEAAPVGQGAGISTLIVVCTEREFPSKPFKWVGDVLAGQRRYDARVEATA
jgi:hypothetical protein